MALKVSTQMPCYVAQDDSEKSVSVTGRLELLLKTSHLSDCTFCVDGSEIGKTQIFKAHKLILASSSPVFEAMCYGPLAEKGSINVSDIEPNAFKNMLQHMYTDSVKFTSMTDACETLYAAKKYMLSQLSQTCHDYIIKNLTPNNVISVFEFLEVLDESDLFQPCLAMISKLLINPHEHVKSSTLAMIVKQDKLSIPEPALFASVVQWAQQECQLQGFPQNGAMWRSILVDADILHHIRFLVFSPKDLYFLKKYQGILNIKEITAVENAVMFKETPPESHPLCNIPKEDDCLPKKFDVPNSICQIATCRERLPQSQYYCVRSFLKASKAVCGTKLILMTRLTVSKYISIQGVRFFSRLMPQADSSILNLNHYYPSPITRHYKEHMEIRLCNKEKRLLSYTTFVDEVEYSTKVTAWFNTPVMLEPGEVYSIFLHSCPGSFQHNTVQYPSAYLSNSEDQNGIVFTFNDFRKLTSANLYQQCSGFLDSIVYYWV